MTDGVAVVRARCLEIAGVTALVGQKVTAGSLAQNTVPPAISVQRAWGREESHLRGSAGVLEQRIQIHAVGTTRAQAVAIQSAVAGDGAGSGLSHFAGTVGGVRILGVLPETVEREDVRIDGGLQEFEVMRAYRVFIER